MFDVEIWGTVSDWTGALLTGLSVLGGVVYFVFDRRRERRAQAGSVLVWLHPYEHGPPMIKMENLSDKPVFDYGFVVAVRSKRRIKRAAREGWANSGPFKWPPNNKVRREVRRLGSLDFHDGSELYLGPNEPASEQPELEFGSAVYDFYAYFRDASGEYWVIDARTQQTVGFWKRRRLNIGPAGIDAS